MKLAISNIAWSSIYDEQMYMFLQSVGFCGLEIAPTRIFKTNPYSKCAEAALWAKELYKKYGLTIPSMQSIWYGHSEKIFGTTKEYNILIEYTKRAIEFAEAINCPNLVFGNPKNRDSENITESMSIAVGFFKEIGDYAFEHNTTIAIEPIPITYNTRFVNTTEQAVELICKSDSKGIKINVDLGSMIYNEEPLDYLKQIHEYINHIHISEPGLDIIRHRDLHIKLLQLLKEIDYHKFISIEMKNIDNPDLVKQTIQYIVNLSTL